MADVDEICLFSHTEGLSYASARVTDRIFPDREHHIAVEAWVFPPPSEPSDGSLHEIDRDG